ncbi:hypothetical protein DFH11DRAFT_705509 [Phellopilus nigrolimitatus]|nr:hypothetical protein DFH11DRAFT_705509 [Phellopilus nigrolimitatus]
MALTEFLHLDCKHYRRKICRPYYSDRELAKNIYKKRREIAAAGCSIGTGLALAPLTAGTSMASSAVATRSVHIAYQKLAMLESEWARRGYRSLPRHVVRDWALPCAVSGAVGGAGIGLDSLFASAGSAAINHAGFENLPHLFGNVLQTHGAVSPVNAQQLGGGFFSGVQQSVGVFANHGHTTALPLYNSDGPYAVGQMGGLNAVSDGVKVGIGQMASYGRENYARRM